METVIIIVLGGIALLAIGLALGLLEMAVLIAWPANRADWRPAHYPYDLRRSLYRDRDTPWAR